MATYAVGDLQGCLDPLLKLLEEVRFDPAVDKLWLVGDLVNRGPQSLATLRYLYNMRDSLVCVLGNHDLHLIAHYYQHRKLSPSDTLAEVVASEHADELIAWLRSLPLMHWDESHNTAMVHAGLNPTWSTEEAQNYAAEVSAALTNDQTIEPFLAAMYGNQPDIWRSSLEGYERLRVITNYFTRMRFCQADGRLNFSHKGSPEDRPKGFAPWYTYYLQEKTKPRVIFGHWAALDGDTSDGRAVGLDTGCVWGNCMTMLCLESNQYFRTSCES